MPLAEPLRVVHMLGGVFDDLDVAFVIGGSVASSLHGLPRATQDIDVVADLRPKHVADLVAALADDFYISEEAVLEAIRAGRSFNVIHLASMYKIDVFVAATSRWCRHELSRAVEFEIADGTTLPVVTAEDIVLEKLRWYVLGDRTSDRQWRDVLGVLHVRGAALDVEYMRSWARRLGVEAELTSALGESGESAG